MRVIALFKMTKIDINNGKFYLNEQFFPILIDKEKNNGHTVGKNSYSNLSISGIIKEFPFNATAYYKNSKLNSITITLESEYLNEHYQPTKDLDFRDYLTPFVDFSKNQTEELISQLICSKKRKFEWGKVQIQVDPRSPTVYGEIKYY